MAKTRLGGGLGSVTFITGVNADFNHFTLSWLQNIDDATAYSDTIKGSRHAGSGVIDYSLDAGGFLSYGAASTAPGFGPTVAGGAVPAGSAGGASCTLTSVTGCTHVGIFILGGGSFSHSKRSGVVPVQYSGQNDGDIVETWAVT